MPTNTQKTNFFRKPTPQCHWCQMFHHLYCHKVAQTIKYGTNYWKFVPGGNFWWRIEKSDQFFEDLIFQHYFGHFNHLLLQNKGKNSVTPRDQFSVIVAILYFWPTLSQCKWWNIRHHCHSVVVLQKKLVFCVLVTIRCQNACINFGWNWTTSKYWNSWTLSWYALYRMPVFVLLFGRA